MRKEFEGRNSQMMQAMESLIEAMRIAAIVPEPEPLPPPPAVKTSGSVAPVAPQNILPPSKLPPSVAASVPVRINGQASSATRSSAVAASLSNATRSSAIPASSSSVAPMPAAQNSAASGKSAAKGFAESCLDSIHMIKEEIRPRFSGDPAMGNFFMKHRMRLTKSVGQLTNSRSKIMATAKSIDEALKAGKQVSEVMWLMLMDALGKSICKQAETEAAVQRTKAFPLALVSILIYESHPKFMMILFGRLMKKCPYLIPRHPKMRPSESLDEYLKRLGMKKDGEGIRENEDKYNERMCGLVAIFAAIVQMQQAKNVIGMDFGWQWVARIISQKPTPVTAMVLHSFFEIAGYQFTNDYQAQAFKLYEYILRRCIPVMEEVNVASAVRLEILLSDAINRNRGIPPLENSAMDR
ncbi:GLE1-like protein-domain-containing protein [Chytridium lagenaria]|nr:GLE1-like protein-domain-containing protein [Chytridium lagenaria]